MGMEIAAFIGVDGQTVTMDGVGKLVLYRKDSRGWQPVKEQSFALEQDKGLREMRRQVSVCLEFLGNCKVLVASAISGLIYYELEKNACSIWEVSGKPAEFLDYILEKEAEAQELEEPVLTLPTPEDLGQGQYRISIKEIQEAEMGVTSKQVLLPLLRRADFYQLEVRCNHMPPWLQVEAMNGRLEMREEKVGPGEVRLVLRKQQCRT